MRCGSRFPCEQRLVKAFPGPGYLHSEDEMIFRIFSIVNHVCYGETNNAYDFHNITSIGTIVSRENSTKKKKKKKILIYRTKEK